MNEVWILSWDVRNANERTGSWVFLSQVLAIEQVIAWCDGEFWQFHTEERARKALELDGMLEFGDDKLYSIASSRIRTAVEL